MTAEATVPGAGPSEGPGAGWVARTRRAIDRRLPPARVVWIALLILAGYGAAYLGGLSVPSLIALPPVALLTDLAFQKVRFERLRFPDAALATSLFLALLLPPTVSLLAAGTAVVAAVTLRHVLRYRGRPWFNPAATGIVVGAVLFGTAPAWWVALGSYGEPLMIGLALVALARSWRSFRIPVTFVAAYGFLAVLEHLVFGQSTSPKVLLLQAIDPTVLFFALFMLPEPRTSPSDPRAQPLFAGIVAVGAVFLPTVLPSLGILAALLLGNLAAVALRRPQVAALPTPSERPARRAPKRTKAARRWPVGYRVTAGIFVFLLVGLVAAASQSSHPTPAVLVGTPPARGGTTSPPSGGGSVGASCTTDNPSIASSTLDYLHKALGPSVVLSYDPNSGTVVFYDPVNQVTVTETDLYEDYGYAEFNGDDYATSGCSP